MVRMITPARAHRNGDLASNLAGDFLPGRRRVV